MVNFNSFVDCLTLVMTTGPQPTPVKSQYEYLRVEIGLIGVPFVVVKKNRFEFPTCKCIGISLELTVPKIVP